MSTVDLVLLGMVKARPQSAYDIHKQLQNRNLHHWVKVGKATVFKNLAALEGKGYLRAEYTQNGNMPPKTVYHITDAGERFFEELMHEQANRDVEVLFDFNVVVSNLNKLPREEALGLLATMHQSAKAKLAFVKEMQPERAGIPLVGRAIMRQQVMVLEALAEWFVWFSAELKKEKEE